MAAAWPRTTPRPSPGIARPPTRDDAIAQSNLGNDVLNGRGVAKDDAQAVAWYRKAADQGNAPAQNDLGVMYEKGRGVAKDEPGRDWYRKAADQGGAASDVQGGPAGQ